VDREIGDIRPRESIRLADPGPSSAPGPAGSATEPPGLVSIVVPCCGQLEYTRLCIPSLLRHSRRPWELIVLDVGSHDGTSEYLDGVAAAASVRVEVVHCPSESGFPAACAEGLARARGEYLVWLNNDAIVMEGWLQQLVAMAGANEAIGMVGPMSNYAPAQQRVVPVPYRIRSRRSAATVGGGTGDWRIVDLEALDRFASQWRDQNKGQWFAVDRLGGFCFLVKRSVLRMVGLFDEGSEPGVLDANALCGKVRQAGYHCVCCRDLFVHHFGSRVVSA
jgi:GT2 family glycosyltransferase